MYLALYQRKLIVTKQSDLSYHGMRLWYVDHYYLSLQLFQIFWITIEQQYCYKINAATCVAERLRAPFLNHSFISPLCLVWVRAPLWPDVRQAKFCLRVYQEIFLGVLPFSPHILIGPSHMS